MEEYNEEEEGAISAESNELAPKLAESDKDGWKNIDVVAREEDINPPPREKRV
jgi:hypothetical protein